MGDERDPLPASPAEVADGEPADGPGTGFHAMSMFDDDGAPIDWRQLPRQWRDGLGLVVSASRRRVVITSGLMGAAALAGVARVALYAALFRLVVGAGGSPPSLGSLARPVVGLALIHLIDQAAAAYQTVTHEVLTREVQVEANRRIIDAATSVDLLAFEDPAFYDQLQRAQAQASFRPMQIVQALQLLSRGLLSGLGVVVGIAVVSPVLVPLVVLVYLPIGVALLLRSTQEHQFMRGITRREREQGYLIGLLIGRHEAKEVRLFGLAPELRRRYEAVTASVLRDMWAVKRRQVRTMVVGNLGGLVLGAIVLGSIGALYQAGRVPLASAAAALLALQQLVGFINLASIGAAQLHEAGVFLHDYSRFIDLAAGAARSVPVPAVTGFGRITTEELSFAYPGNPTPALDRVTLDIPAGQVVALVGENGSGKTTLAKILAGLYRPTSGRLLVDGREAVPGSVTVLFQDFVRYAFSAADNIALGDSDRLGDQAAVAAAAEQAGAAALIAGLPRGYDTGLTRVFEDGVDLSVGQWQRVAVARALFRRAELVVLDEPTAALDPRAEAELFDAIRTLMAGRTVVLISHRFSTVRNADRILVLDRGRVREQGTHQSLVAAGGTYAELYHLQAAAFTDPDPEPASAAPRPAGGR